MPLLVANQVAAKDGRRPPIDCSPMARSESPTLVILALIADGFTAVLKVIAVVREVLPAATHIFVEPETTR